MAKNKVVAYFYDEEIGYESPPALKRFMRTVCTLYCSAWSCISSCELHASLSPPPRLLNLSVRQGGGDA